MTQQPQQGGASVQARGRIPSTDLASLVSLLADAFPPNEDRPGTALSWQVLTFDASSNRFGINTYGVLRRLLAQKGFLEKFRQADSSGFLRDIANPPKSFTAKMGGKIFEDNIGGISRGVNKLKQQIAEQLDQLGVTADKILVADPEAALKRLADETGLKDFLNEMPAQMVSIEFAKADRPASQRDRDVARVFSAAEEIQAEDWLERMSTSMADTQALRDDEFDDIQRDKLTETLRQDFDKSDSQVTRFLNFLEDEALARVRLAVSFAIMQGLATQATKSKDAGEQAFEDYVQRVLALFNLYGSPETKHAWHFDLSRDFGLAADFSASTELVKAMFYNCLPVWAEWNTQLFESRRIDPASRGVSVVREVSYRFRVNGKDPRNESKHAFDSRLERLEQVLGSDDGDSRQNQYRVRRSIIEVAFLWLILNPNIATDNIQAEADALTARLKTMGKAGILQLLSDLSAWSSRVKGLSKTLVDLLRNKSRNILAHAQRSVDDLYLVVQQGVVDWAAIERSRGKVRDPLIKPSEGQAESIEWFKHIKVAKKPNDVIDPLFSVRVRTVLHERTLTSLDEESTTIQTAREIPKELLNITWRPIRVEQSEEKHRARPRSDIEPHWLMGCGVDIWYEPELLKQRDNSRVPEEDRRQYRAATISAMTVLVYCVLQVLAERLSKEREQLVATLMLRFQTQGKEAAGSEGDPLIYAAAQAIESALMREVPVRMQGLVTTGNRIYKDRGAAFALSSAFPLVLGTRSKPFVERVAVVVYATRPCDDHPDIKDADGFVFRAKTYLAEAVEQPFPGYRLSFERMQSHVVESRDAFRSPQLIVEEVSRLHGLGYEHVILISNHYGNRRINRSAQRHSPHTQTTFLDEVATNFPAVSLYMLRRDVFPATRLHNRARAESAFEAIRLSDHNEFAIMQGEGVVKQLIPAFTFGTLAVVGNDDAARPQSGFCTYFLDTDYQVRNAEWRERVRSNIMSTSGVRECLLTALRGLHFLEAEKQPEGGLFKPVLDPFSWVQPTTTGAAGEIQVSPPSRRKGDVLLSLPALLSHVTAALHRGRG